MTLVKEYGLSDKLNFGKHRGKTIEEVLKTDPTYISWAIEEIEWFGLDEEAGDRLDDYMWDYWEDPKNWDMPKPTETCEMRTITCRFLKDQWDSMDEEHRKMYLKHATSHELGKTFVKVMLPEATYLRWMSLLRAKERLELMSTPERET